MMMAENAGGVRRSLAHDESAREKQTPLTLRNEAQLNCVSLRPEFDCEVTWGAVKGQDERPLRGALDSAPSHHRRSMQLGKELIKDGRHVGLENNPVKVQRNCTQAAVLYTATACSHPTYITSCIAKEATPERWFLVGYVTRD